MPEVEGFKTLDLIMQELGISKPKAREAIKALKIQPGIFNKDKRVKCYSPRDIQRIKEWLTPRDREGSAVEFLPSRPGGEEATSACSPSRQA